MLFAALARAALWGAASAALPALWVPAMPSPALCNAALALLFGFWQMRRLFSRAASARDARRLLDAPPPNRWLWARLAHAHCALDWIGFGLLVSMGPAPSSWGPFLSRSCSCAQALAHLWQGA